MNVFYKIVFLLLALIVGFMIIIPSIQNQKITTDIVIFGLGSADSIFSKTLGSSPPRKTMSLS